MIDPRELRIGNWAFYNGSVVRILVSNLMEIVDYEKFKSSEPNPYSPIPLTEEWLIKFGFEKDKWESFSENLNSYTGQQEGYIYKNVYAFLSHNNKPTFFGRRNTNPRITENVWNFKEYGMPIYVHQLQNLYFALTNTELELKEETKK